MTTGAANKKKGSAFEILLMKHLRDQGLDVERLRLTGAQDEGDLVVRFDNGERLVIEAKSGALHAAQFVREAQAETKHYTEHRELPADLVHGVAVVKARGKGIGDAYVITTLADYLRGHHAR